jgi:hypothetical protein
LGSGSARESELVLALDSALGSGWASESESELALETDQDPALGSGSAKVAVWGEASAVGWVVSVE